MKRVNEMKKATIYDYARMCKFYKNCDYCALAKTTAICQVFIEEHPDEANEIILKWCEEHPVETRQSKFLKMFPNASIGYNDCLEITHCDIDRNLYTNESCATRDCEKCCEEYWLEG